MQRRILVVVAHPDDEVLGVGGTLLKHRNAGDQISILILANGEDARDSAPNVDRRLKQAREVAKKLNAKLFIEDLPDNQFDTVPLLSIAKLVEKVLVETQPEIIYTHFHNDLNIDHRMASQAVLTACRPQPQSSVQQIIAFETPSSTEWQIKSFEPFCPNHYIDIHAEVEEKKSLLKIYEPELREFPHPRSLRAIETQATYRGVEVGLHAAEAFHIVRSIKK